ncbi:MAG: FAD-binding oxidoreductase [Hyphomicrobiaceae bacterium]
MPASSLPNPIAAAQSLAAVEAAGPPRNREPTWYEASAGAAAPRPPLAGDLKADVAIVGAGFVGTSAALHLASRGLSVVVLETRHVGGGGSGRNGGLMVPGPRRDQDWLEAKLGRDGAKALWEMYLEARAHLRGLVTGHGIDCDMRDGFIHCAHKRAFVGPLADYAEKMARDYGYTAMTPLDRAKTAEAVGSEAYHGALYDADGGHVHPLKLVRGIARAAEAKGAVIHEATRVLSVDEVAGGVEVRTATGRVRAGMAILATNGYSEGLAADLDRHVMPIEAYVIATEPLPEPLRSQILPRRPSVSDTRFVVNYFRVSADHRMVFGGGETYGAGHPADIGAFVRPYMLSIYPQLRDIPVAYGWSGRIGITPNRMPFVRRLSPHVLTAAGLSGQGVVLGPYYGQVLAEAVAGTMERFDRLAALDVPVFPGGRRFRLPMLMAALTFYAIRDRL